MNKYQVYESEDYGRIRMIEIDGDLMFVARDVAKALKYDDPCDAVDTICKSDDELKCYFVWFLCSGKKIKLRVINRGNVERLILFADMFGDENSYTFFWNFRRMVDALYLERENKDGTEVVEAKVMNETVNVGSLENKMYNESIIIYNNTNITFKLDSINKDVMVNATQMAKAFKKQPYEFLRLPSTKQLVEAITGKYRISENQLVITLQGAPEFGGGTWMHRLIALSFAQWLSVDFHLICLEKIEELLMKGYTKLDHITKEDLARMILESEQEKKGLQIVIGEQQLLLAERNERIEQCEVEIKLLKDTCEDQQKLLEEQQEKIEYVDKVLDSDGDLDIGQAAKTLDLSFGRNTLFKKLREKGIFFKDRNEPKQEYIDRGYFKMKLTNIEGLNKYYSKVVVTLTGLEFIDSLFRKVA